MTRNEKGIIGWAIATIALMLIMLTISSGAEVVILPMVVNIVAMVVREIWQHKTCPSNPFEWDDVITYSFIIGATGVIGGLVLVALGIIE